MPGSGEAGVELSRAPQAPLRDRRGTCTSGTRPGGKGEPALGQVAELPVPRSIALVPGIHPRGKMRRSRPCQTRSLTATALKRPIPAGATDLRRRSGQPGLAGQAVLAGSTLRKGARRGAQGTHTRGTWPGPGGTSADSQRHTLSPACISPIVLAR